MRRTLALLAVLAAVPAAARAQDYYDPAQGYVPYSGRTYTTAPSLDQPSRAAYSVLGGNPGTVAVPVRRAVPVAVRAPAGYAADPFDDGAYDAYGQATGRYGAGPDAYGAVPGRGAIPRETVSFDPSYAPGTIVVHSDEKRLYFVTARGEAIRYGVGVGRPGFGWNGVQTVTAMKEWPSWTPPAEMLARRPDLPRYMAGGIENPLGARALYLGSSLYRIHGSNEPESIGTAVSSGCIRMLNEDVIDLYSRAKVGAKVIVM